MNKIKKRSNKKKMNNLWINISKFKILSMNNKVWIDCLKIKV